MDNQKQNTSKIQKTIMKELGLEKLPPKKQEELLVKMGEVILKKMFLETVEKLDEEGRKHFEKMLEDKSAPEEIEKFLKEKFPEYDKMLEKIVSDLKEEMKESIDPMN